MFCFTLNCKLQPKTNLKFCYAQFNYQNTAHIDQEVVCKSLSAYSVGQMLLHISKRELVDYSRLNWSFQEPLTVWTMSLILSVCCWVLTAHFYGFQMMRVGLHVRVGCSYLIYRKSLKLGQQATEDVQKTMGKMVSDNSARIS